VEYDFHDCEYDGYAYGEFHDHDDDGYENGDWAGGTA